MQTLFHFFMKYLMKYLTYFYFSKVEVVGRNRVPKDQPVIFSCNHQNAFMDALILGGFSPKTWTSSLTRGDVFNKKFMWFIDGVRMLPIYRMRDGYDQLAKNEAVFEEVRKRLRNNEAISIFSEGNHGNDYFLRPLSKGSSRMALESQEAMMERDIQIVPAAVNYYHHQRPKHKLSLVFGEPISVKDYIEEYSAHKAKGINKLKAAVTQGMKDCLILPEETEDYQERRSLINRNNEGLAFADMKERLSERSLKPVGKRQTFLYNLGRALGIFNFLPLMLISKILRPIKDIVFYGSIKWSFAAFGFPLWYLLVYGILAGIWGWQVGLMGVGVGVFTLYLRQYLIRWSNVSH